MAFRWRVDDGPLMTVFGSSTPKSTKKNVVKVGPTLKKNISGSMHEHHGNEQTVDVQATHHLHISHEIFTINLKTP